MSRQGNVFRRFALAVAATLAVLIPGGGEAAEPPGPTELGGQKVLTLVGRDPPALRCNNNMQVAAQLANIYKVPIVVVPIAFAKPGTKAPTVWYGKDLLAEDGGEKNGMISFTELADIFEIDGIPKQSPSGRLTEADVKPKHEDLVRTIKEVK